MTKKIAYLFFGIIFSLVLPQGALGIGQITQPIIFKDILKGQTMESDLILYNSADKELIYQLNADGKIKDWASFYSIGNAKDPISEISVPAKSNIKAKVRFAVPQDALNGEYSGEVAILAAPEKNKNEATTNVSVGSRIGRPVSITVTGKEIIKFSAFVTPKTYFIEIGKPLEINAKYYNTGNVAIKPDLKIRISKDGQSVFNVIFPYPENEEAVKPMGSKIIPVVWQSAGQPEGLYKTEITVLLDSAVIQEDEFTFTVGEYDYNSNNNWLLGSISSIGGGQALSILTLIGGFLLMLTIFFSRKKILKKKTLRKKVVLR